MLEVLPESQGELVAVRVGGMLTHRDIQDVLLPRLAQVGGQVRLIMVFGEDFEGEELSAGQDIASFVLRHRKGLKRLALVAKPDWVRSFAEWAAATMECPLGKFRRREAEQAWEWIRA